jgi:hypothetical protein
LILKGNWVRRSLKEANMKRYEGGAQVKPGAYVNLGTGQFTFIGGETASLPRAKARYARIPLALVFVLGPVAGLAYIIFIPLAGIVSLVMFTGYRLKAIFSPLAARQAKQ